ncbi:hypothetical protein ACHAXM_005656 [Skeletonema potamos]|jgi:hypothetical protein
MKLVSATSILLISSSGVASALLRKNSKNPKNIDTPGGTCTTDTDCFSRIRSEVPENLNPTGPKWCDCYAASSKFPFMECEGQDNCVMAMCQYDACAGFEAYCPLAPGDKGMAECALRPIGDSKELLDLVEM